MSRSINLKPGEKYTSQEVIKYKSLIFCLDLGGGVRGSISQAIHHKENIKNFELLCETKKRMVRKCYIFFNNCAFHPEADISILDEGRGIKK